jgi:hypothetical protein
VTDDCPNCNEVIFNVRGALFDIRKERKVYFIKGAEAFREQVRAMLKEEFDRLFDKPPSPMNAYAMRRIEEMRVQLENIAIG